MGLKAEPPDERRDDHADERRTAWAAGLRAKYDEVAQEPVPDKFLELLEDLADAESRQR